MLTSLLGVFLSCAHIQTQTKTYADKLNPYNVTGAGLEIQEAINNRLFSLELKKYQGMEQ